MNKYNSHIFKNLLVCFLIEVVKHLYVIADDDRAVRRESYLKATEGGRVHFDSDLSDAADVSSQVLRR